MFNTITSVNSDVRRAFEVSLRKDAADDHRETRNQARTEETEARAQVFRFGQAARRLAVGDEPARSPRTPSGARQGAYSPEMPEGLKSAGFDLLQRAVKSYAGGAADDEPASGLHGPELPISGADDARASGVTFEELQRASSADQANVFEAAQRQTFEGKPVPYEALQLAVATEAFGNVDEVDDAFAIEAEDGHPPFGRDVPFDLASPRNTNDPNAVTPPEFPTEAYQSGAAQEGAASQSGSYDLSLRMRAELASERYQVEAGRQVPGSATPEPTEFAFESEPALALAV